MGFSICVLLKKGQISTERGHKIQGQVLHNSQDRPAEAFDTYVALKGLAWDPYLSLSPLLSPGPPSHTIPCNTGGRGGRSAERRIHVCASMETIKGAKLEMSASDVLAGMEV